jgi:SpoVK/Ycf46/Vps4 family AAA+-type ATPase
MDIKQLAESCRQRGAVTLAQFTGPSSTGKTMAAQMLGAALNLGVYRIDLSAVVGKYAGETEKNLERIFAEAERSGALLFFDDADSLFGSRGGNDPGAASRAAEYLLRRLERHHGVVILGTATVHGLHPVLRRRVHHVVDC